METKFKIGDKVKVIDSDNCYGHYDAMADQMGLKNWKVGNNLSDGDEGMIVAIEKHPDLGKIIYGMYTNGREYIMNVDGLELVRDNTSGPIVDTNKTIKIDRTTLNEYYDAATAEQKKFLNDNFKLDGTTTVKSVRELHDIACEKWKRIIKKNHPECFEDDKHFTREELQNMFNVDIMIRNSGDYMNKGFYLQSCYKWEIKTDSLGVQVLIPTKPLK